MYARVGTSNSRSTQSPGSWQRPNSWLPQTPVDAGLARAPHGLGEPSPVLVDVAQREEAVGTARAGTARSPRESRSTSSWISASRPIRIALAPPASPRDGTSPCIAATGVAARVRDREPARTPCSLSPTTPARPPLSLGPRRGHRAAATFAGGTLDIPSPRLFPGRNPVPLRVPDRTSPERSPSRAGPYHLRPDLAGRRVIIPAGPSSDECSERRRPDRSSRRRNRQTVRMACCTCCESNASCPPPGRPDQPLANFTPACLSFSSCQSR